MMYGKKGQVTIFIILGMVLLFSFILLLFISSNLTNLIQINNSVVFESEQCDDAFITIDFNRIQNYGQGNAQNIITSLPSSVEFAAGDKIDLLFESSYTDDFLIENLFLTDYPGLILEQGNHYVHFILEGSQSSSDLEIVDFEINFNNAIAEVVVSDEERPLEKQGDGFFEDQPGQDEVLINSDGSKVDAYLRVSSFDDGFYVYYSCLE